MSVPRGARCAADGDAALGPLLPRSIPPAPPTILARSSRVCPRLRARVLRVHLPVFLVRAPKRGQREVVFRTHAGDPTLLLSPSLSCPPARSGQALLPRRREPRSLLPRERHRALAPRPVPPQPPHALLCWRFRSLEHTPFLIFAFAPISPVPHNLPRFVSSTNSNHTMTVFVPQTPSR